MQFHLPGDLLLDAAVLVDAEDRLRRQVRELALLRLELPCLRFVLEEQHERAAPLVQLVLHLLDVVQGMVGRFLSHAQNAQDIVAASGLAQYRHVSAVFLEQVLAVEAADDLHPFALLPDVERQCRRLPRFDAEETAVCKDAAVCHALSGDEEISSFIKR